MKATNVQGGSLPLDADGKGKGKGTPVVGTGAYTGTVKSYNSGKAWGFISYEGQDLFFHIKDCVDNNHPNAGDTVQFDMQDNPKTPGTQKAANVTGSTGGWNDGSGGGGGKGK